MCYVCVCSDPDRVFEGLTITPEERATLMKFIDHRMRPQVRNACHSSGTLVTVPSRRYVFFPRRFPILYVQELRIRSDIDVTCFEYDGVEAVRAALVRPLQLTVLVGLPRLSRLTVCWWCNRAFLCTAADSLRAVHSAPRRSPSRCVSNVLCG